MENDLRSELHIPDEPLHVLAEDVASEVLRLRGGAGGPGGDCTGGPDGDGGGGPGGDGAGGPGGDGAGEPGGDGAGGPGGDSERCEEELLKKSDEKGSVWLEEGDVRRREGWQYWEDRIQQRPAPGDLPRSPEMEYANMTACAVGEEGGVVFSPLKDKYRRTDAQLKDVVDAHEDQRNIAGGSYRCLDEGYENFELTIQKGFKSKALGITLKKFSADKGVTIFQSFSMMRYEYFRFGESGRRYRQTWPEETPTGFIWYGYGGDAYPLPTSDVHVYCERVDRDVHFSGEKCGRNTEEPGASQMLCANANCGVVSWHLSRKCYRKGDDDNYSEKWQEHFALVRYRSGRKELVWTHDHRKLKKSRWERLEASPEFNACVVDQVNKERVESIVARKCLPQFTFSTPTYVPQKQHWKVAEPLLRQKKDSQW